MRPPEPIYTALRALRARRGTSRFGEPEFAHLDALVDTTRPSIDVGANAGFYTFRLSKLTSRVLAIEPNPELARRLRTAGAWTFTANLTVLEAACGSQPGRADFTIPVGADGRVDTGQAHLSAAGERGFSVRVETLDALIAEAGIDRPGFVKIDVEGAELQVLRGAVNTLTEARPVILCEVQEIWTKRYDSAALDVFDFLAAHDYRASVLQGDRFVPVSEPDDRFSNYVFRPA